MSSSQIVENYQLKWHSHLTNLNSSVSTLYRNDKFADVLLFTSQSDGGCGIPAHKIILSSCSHFFASIFELNPAPPNSMVYIVLPPELSKRSIQILIQYMYSGEATVSNDILNEVLHGGELLKIRGLWRNKPPTNESTGCNQYTMSSESACSATKDGPIFSEKSLYEHRPQRLNSANNSNLSIIKESPVIVTSLTHLTNPASHKTLPASLQLQQHHQPNIDSIHSHHHSHHPQHQSHIKSNNEIGHMIPPPPPSQIPSSSSSSSLVHSPDSHTGNIIVKKEMTINAMNNDDLVSVPVSHYGLVSLQIAAAVKKAQQVSEKRCVNKLINENGSSAHCTMLTAPTNSNISRSAAQYEQIGRRFSDDFLYAKETNDIPTGSHSNLRDIDGNRHDVSRHDINRHDSSRHDTSRHDASRHIDKSHIISPTSKHTPRPTTHHMEPIVEHSVRDSFDKPLQPAPPSSMVLAAIAQQSNQIPEELHLMAIKQEPVEWPDFDHESSGLEKSNIEIAVKPELIYSKGDTDEEDTDHQEPIYSPLTCELCSETFTIPADWVRHIESHSEPVHCVPKKRKRIEHESLTENIAALRCDLCSMYFVTPAEWVRHVQNMHTETELALSNNSATIRRSNINNTTITSGGSNQRLSRQPQPHSSIDNSDRCSDSNSEKSCIVCKKMFPSYASMVIHKRTHTGMVYRSETNHN